MNHLTNLYKHKCEQLQEQINNIKRMLNEVNSAGMVDIPSPFPSVVPPNNPTGIDPRMFDPALQPDNKPRYQPREYYGPYPPQTANPGDLYHGPNGGTAIWLNGKWRNWIPTPFDIEYGVPLTPDGRYDWDDLHNAPSRLSPYYDLNL